MNRHFKQEARKYYTQQRALGHTASTALAIARSMARLNYRTCMAEAGEYQLPRGLTIRVSVEADEHMGAPWEECDGHGIIEHERSRHATKGHRWDLGGGWYYNHADTLPRALREGWDAPPYRTGNAHERAWRAMRRDADYIARWLNGDCFYLMVTVELVDSDGDTVATDTLGGIEHGHHYTCRQYLSEEARGMAAQLLRSYRRELRESGYWAARDVLTVEA